MPLRVPGSAGNSGAVDLRLAHARNHFDPVRPLTAVSIPQNSAEGVTVGSDGLRITLRGARAIGQPIMNGQSIFYHGVSADTDAAVAPTLNGVELFAVLRSRLSPQQLHYDVALPAGASMSERQGGAVITVGDKVVARVPAPAARDAQGSFVATQMHVVGHELVLDVPHRGAGVAYPLLVDPTVITITETAEHWHFVQEECEPYRFTAPKVAEIIAPELTFSHPNCSGGGAVYADGAEWKWEVPSSPLPPAANFNVALYGVAFSAHLTRGTYGAYWSFNATCGHEFGRDAYGYNTAPPPSIIELRVRECSENGPRTVSEFLETGALNGEGFKTVTVSASLSVAGILISDTWPPPIPAEYYGLANAGRPDGGPCLKADPVNCATGNLVESQTDLSVGGIPGLKLTRTYNSLLAGEQSKEKLTPGPFGYGWTAPYSAHLTFGELCEEKEKGCDPTATVYDNNGSAVRFELANEKYKPVSFLAQSTLTKEGSSYTYTRPNQERLSFDSSGQLVSETDRNGNTLTLSYESKGHLESVADSAGRKLTFAYNSEGLVESATDPMGHTVKYTYEAKNLKSVTQPAETALRWQFKYNAEHELTSETDGRGYTTTTEYNSAHEVTTQTDALSRTYKWSYAGTTEEPQTTIAEPTGSETREVFNELDRPLTIIRALGTSYQTRSTYEYDLYGNLIAATDGRGHKTTYTYNSAGDRLSETSPLGDETKWTYDGTHDVSSVTTPEGEKTTFVRDSHGNIEKVERAAPGGETQTETYEHNSKGELTRHINPLGHAWTYEYDVYGDRTSETDPEGNKRTWEYNKDSQETATVTPRGNVSGGEPATYKTTIERNAKGLPLTITAPLGHKTKYTYNGDGQVESETDPAGNKTTYTYNADDELTKVEAPNKTVTETGYDGAGEVISQTDGNKHTTKYIRNLLEEITEVIDPRERKTTDEYDAAGNLTASTDAEKRTATYSYNVANQLTSIHYSEGTTHAVEYEYNKDGQVTVM
ncbi:MAG: DUF6531 domain-containing protein, partial [Solirubrobacteraceae bacterium]